MTNKNMSDLLINPNGLTGDHAYCLHLSFGGGNDDKQGVTAGILLVTTHHFNNKCMHNFILLLIDSDYQQNGIYTKQLHLFSRTAFKKTNRSESSALKHCYHIPGKNGPTIITSATLCWVQKR